MTQVGLSFSHLSQEMASIGATGKTLAGQLLDERQHDAVSPCLIVKRDGLVRDRMFDLVRESVVAEADLDKAEKSQERTEKKKKGKERYEKRLGRKPK